jgi:hypothetical protein
MYQILGNSRKPNPKTNKAMKDFQEKCEKKTTIFTTTKFRSISAIIWIAIDFFTHFEHECVPEIPIVKEIGNKISKPEESAPPLFISPLFSYP